MLRRRLLMAGGVGALGTAVGIERTVQRAEAAPFDTRYVDLGATPYDVKVGHDDVEVALANARAINRAINEHPANAQLVLPAGDVYVAVDPLAEGIHRFAAIRINGTDRQRLTLSGRGTNATRIIMTGSQRFGLSQIIQVSDGPRQVTLCDFSIEHGPNAKDFDPRLISHQIELNAEKIDVVDTEIRNINFGTCVGDAIRLSGGAMPESSTLLLNTRINHVTMRLGKHHLVPLGCRSGISFQKGIRDLLFNDFYIIGPKNSCLDCEPTSHNVLDNITISNGTIDNSQGDNFIAASFDGFEDSTSERRTSFLTNSRMVNVRIRKGQLQVVSTRGCTLDNVVIEAKGARPDAQNAPMLFIFRANEDLTVRNVDILRDTGTPPGPLLTVRNTANSPRRINIEGGTWTTRVGTGNDVGYVDLIDVDRLRIRGTRIRVENQVVDSRAGIRIVPESQDMTNLHLDSVAIEAPDGLGAGFAVAALKRKIANLMITGCSISSTAKVAIAFSASDGGVADRFPVVQGNDFERCGDFFATDHAEVFPLIAGNRGGRCTLTGRVAPENVVAALQGSQYIHQAANVTSLWWKATGTGTTGWRKIA